MDSTHNTCGFGVKYDAVQGSGCAYSLNSFDQELLVNGLGDHRGGT